MNYVGIDYHKKYSVVTAIDEMGQVIQTTRLDNRAEPFQAFFNSLGGPSETVLEATRTWGVLYDLLEELDGVESVILAHSLKVRAIAEAKIKTDTIDSHTLAQLLRVDLIPAAYSGQRDAFFQRNGAAAGFSCQNADSAEEPHPCPAGSLPCARSARYRSVRKRRNGILEETKAIRRGS